jgi:DNA-binding FadR family transcriptional regulator
MPSGGQLCFEIGRDKTRHCAADEDFHLAILDATHNPVLQGFRGAIDTILSTVFLVAVGSVGWFKENLPNHAAAARALKAAAMGSGDRQAAYCRTGFIGCLTSDDCAGTRIVYLLS